MKSHVRRSTVRFSCLAFSLAPRLAAAVLAFLLPAPAAASGFSLGEQGVRAMGTAGAFTAVADDPSAIFYNAGALALVKSRILTVGAAALGVNESQYQGLPPGVGQGTTGEQDTPLLNFPAHAYLLLPFGQSAKVGLGLYQPFGFETSWQEPASFAGRYVSVSSQLRTYDLNPSFGMRFGENFGFGVGAVARVSDLAMGRRLPGVNPSTGQMLDIASAEVGTDFDYGFGWNAGLLFRTTNSGFALGLAYRSPIEVEYQGAARLTQVPTGDPQFDQLVTASLPFGKNLPIETALQFPDTATVGLAIGLSRSLTLALDVGWTGWSELEGLSVTYTNDPTLNDTVQGPYEDAYSYRGGLRYATQGGMQWRLGLALEQTPVPDASLGPFFPDADRYVAAFGWGLDWLDLAVQWHQYDSRTTLTNVDGVNGTYEENGFAVAVSVTKLVR